MEQAITLSKSVVHLYRSIVGSAKAVQPETTASHNTCSIIVG